MEIFHEGRKLMEYSDIIIKYTKFTVDGTNPKLFTTFLHATDTSYHLLY